MLIRNTGEKVKELRLSRNLTLKELSEQTGLSMGHLSQFERGLSALSLYSLEKVGRALGVPLSVFLEPQQPRSEQYLTRSYDYHALQAPESALLYNRLTADFSQRQLEPMLVTILPHAQGEEVYPKGHHGEEFIYVLEGLLTVLLAEERYLLNPGDSMHYEASQPHEWYNQGDRLVRLISVNTPTLGDRADYEAQNSTETAKQPV